MSKKIMVISSSLDPRLVGAVEAARALGMETVACVREEDDGSLAHADRFYLVDGNKTEELLEIAKKEKVDGVLGTWDKSVLSAAMIARELGLPGNSPDCVRTLMDKGRFRSLQREAGVFCPGYFETDTSEGLEEKCAKLHFPIIVKPAVCSSSFGMTKLYDRKEVISAFEKASAYSRNGLSVWRNLLNRIHCGSWKLTCFLWRTIFSGSGHVGATGCRKSRSALCSMCFPLLWTAARRQNLSLPLELCSRHPEPGSANLTSKVFLRMRADSLS